MNERTINLISVAISLIITATVWLASPASIKAQEAEIQVARKKIEVLLKKAEQLQDEGAADKAEQLIEQAQDLKARLAKATAKRKKKLSDGEHRKILQGLKSGAASLRALGRNDEAAKLERLAEELHGKAADGDKRRRGPSEREVALKQLKIMRYAMQGLIDADRHDAAELMEHTIHAQELALEGRKDKKAIEIRESAPTLGQRVELLMLASKQLREAGKQEQAAAVGNLGEQLLDRFRAQQKRKNKGEDRREGDRRREGNSEEREAAAHQIEVMQLAHTALREGERGEWANLLNRSIQAATVRYKRLKGEEAKYVLEHEPKRAETVEALGLASKLWREFGNQKNAAAVGRLAEKLATRRDGEKREQPQKKEGVQNLKKLQDEIAELKNNLEEKLEKLKELERKIDR